ncbi:MAG: NAD(P)H-dependent oxidoreductase [Litoreibacter sp.]|nr:NAD(P)H-dependent oxidoreductase [Litoreibacter sp.]MCY4334361.1 NAD(P)H-dependent oxidoreductase [Litoreibacter sp.]
MTLLHIDSSARNDASITRKLTAAIVAQLGGDVIRRDLSDSLPLLTQDWVEANFTPADQRSDAQKDTLATSDALVAELEAADTVIIGMPIYNFSVPGALKAWIDQIARAGRTFKYTENGPVGLLEGKRAIIVVASGGVAMDSPVDFATPYLRQVLGFVGITNIEIIAADGLVSDAESKVSAAHEAVAKLAA